MTAAIIAMILAAPFDGSGVSATVPLDRHHGVKGLTYGGYTWMDGEGSANSPVVFFQTPAGKVGYGGAPFHGSWTLDRASLLVDGTPTPFTPSVGPGSLVSTTSTIYGAVRETLVSAYLQDGIDEHYVFEGVDATKTVATFYASLGTRANRLTEWAAFDAGRNLLASGTTTDTGRYLYMPAGTRSVAQYDPVAGNGIVTAWVLDDPRAYAFIVDRPYDNKLYLDVPALWGAANKRFELDQSIRFFEAGSAWTATAAATVPEPATWLLALLALAFLIRR